MGFATLPIFFVEQKYNFNMTKRLLASREKD